MNILKLLQVRIIPNYTPNSHLILGDFKDSLALFRDTYFKENVPGKGLRCKKGITFCPVLKGGKKGWLVKIEGTTVDSQESLLSYIERHMTQEGISWSAIPTT